MDPKQRWPYPLMILVLVIAIPLAHNVLVTPLDIDDARSVEVVRRYLLEESKTYRYDGVVDLVHLGPVANLDGEEWEVTILFTSRSAGYGDRIGQVIAQVLTSHSMRLVISTDGSVKSVVIDNVWDELRQKLL